MTRIPMTMTSLQRRRARLAHQLLLLLITNFLCSDGHNATSSCSSTGPEINPRMKKSKSSPTTKVAAVSRPPGAHRGSTTNNAPSTTSMAKSLRFLTSSPRHRTHDDGDQVAIVLLHLLPVVDRASQMEVLGAWNYLSRIP